MTDVNGAFSIPDVPTILGDIFVSATATMNGKELSGISARVPPVRGGVTDVGDITLRADLIAYWSFDDLHDPTADLAGRHDGDVVGATFTTTDIAPVPGNVAALVFNGAGDHVVAADPDTFSFGPTSPMSIALWLKQTAFSGVYHVFGKRAGCGPINYQLARDGRLVHFSSGSQLLLLGADFPFNTWTHVAVTYDGIQTAKIYVNGQEIVSSNNFVMTAQNSQPFTIGTSGTCPASQTFPGIIDEVRIYNVALPPEEIANLAGQNDTDGDGLSDRDEILLGTNLFLADTDQDGWSDGAEVAVGTNPLDPTSRPAPTALVSGELRNATLTVANEVDLYTFTLGATERVRLQVVNSGGFVIAPCLKVLTVNGQAVPGGLACGGFSAHLDLVLSAGTYLVLVYDNGASHTGGYTLGLQ